MSNFQLAHFNGSIKRNKNQDAIFKSLSGKDEFMRHLEEQRLLRSKESKQKTAAIIIQRCWNRYHVKCAVHNKIREDFDNHSFDSVQDIVLQMSRISIFYQHKFAKDSTRLVSVCSNYLSKCSNEVDRTYFSTGLKNLFIIRVIEFLRRSDTSTVLNIPLRFLETFLSDNEVLSAVQHHYFNSLIHLISISYQGTPENIEVEHLLPPRLQTYFDYMLLPFKKCSADKMDQLIIHLWQDVISHPKKQCIVAVIIPQIVLAMGNTFSCLSGLENLNKLFTSLKGNQEKLIALYLAIAFLLCVKQEVENQALFHVLASMLPTTSIENPVDQVETFITNSIKEGLDSPAIAKLILLSLNQNTMNMEDVLAFYNYPVQRNVFQVFCEKSASQSHVFLMKLFKFIVKMESAGVEKSIMGLTRKTNENTYINSLKYGWAMKIEESTKFLSAVSLCSTLLISILRGSVDDDFRINGSLYNCIPDFVEISKEFLELCLGLIDLAFPDDFWCTSQQAEQKRKDASEWTGLYEQLVLTLQVIFRKDNRVKFLPSNFWTSHNRQVVINKKIWYNNRKFQRNRQNYQNFAFVRYLRDDRGNQDDSDSENTEDERPSNTDLRNLSIIKSIPFVVPFEQRLMIFRDLVNHDKSEIGIERIAFGAGLGRSGHSIAVRRQHLYDDAFEALLPGKCPNLRLPLRVSMINWVGLDELGQDGGGIFREFLSELLKTGFDPNRGLFKYTHDRFLYPNPNSVVLYPHNYSQHYYFLGRMVAKLIYEGLMMDMHFADFFLIQLLSTSNSTFIDLEQMKSYDPTVYRHLYDLLLSSEEDIRALALDFSVTVEDLDCTKIIDLKPNGRNIVVTHENRVEYVQLYVNFFLYKQIEHLIDAMRAGVSDVINPAWLAMFDPSELQIIVSGVDSEIDMNDMMTNCAVYHPGDKFLFKFHILFFFLRQEMVEYVSLFWNVVRSFTNEEKAALLKFITGCSRPPIEGFQFLQPKIGIQVISGADDQLPMSATCMNLFKLPKYKTREILEEKLRYAINSGAGFELQ